MTITLKKAVTTHFHVYGDPTHTLTLRTAFARAMGKRFKELRKSVNIAIINDDCFGLDKSGFLQVHQASGPGYRAFAFPRSADKMSAFSNWFDEKVNTGILEVHRGQQVGSAVENAWTNKYVKQGYERGIERGRRELLNAGYNVPPLEATGGIWGAFNSPMHMDRVGVLYTRTFTGLKGITAAMDKQISDVLGLGLAEGLGPRELARQLTRTIGSGLGMTDKLGRFIPAERRAKVLARTEIIRAHHEGTIQEYENWRVEGVHVKAEWETAGDDRVCEECATLEGSIFTLEEIRPMIPVHPMCRCVALPLDVTGKEKGRE